MKHGISSICLSECYEKLVLFTLVLPSSPRILLPSAYLPHSIDIPSEGDKKTVLFGTPLLKQTEDAAIIGTQFKLQERPHLSG